MNRFHRFRNASEGEWRDWKWQMRNRLTTNIEDFFPGLSVKEKHEFREYIGKFKFAITPYTLSLVALDDEGNPLKDDPVWNQIRYLSLDEFTGPSEYDGVHENWEATCEMPTGLLQHKYPDRAILRVVDTCFSHCNYCYLARRVLDKQQDQTHRSSWEQEWQNSLEYIKSRQEIRDVLISGGDPLILDNERIERILSDLRSIPGIRTLRLNTRVLTYNPFRIDAELAQIFKKYNLTVLEIHAGHPNEITEEFDVGLRLFDEAGHRPMILWRSPLLNGINDNEAILEELFFKLYERRILPYYLFHYAPYSLGRTTCGLSVRKGSRMLSRLRRSVPGPAFPRYTLFHLEGKQDIPLDLEGTHNFRYKTYKDGNPCIVFKNWKDKWVSYPDIKDKSFPAE